MSRKPEILKIKTLEEIKAEHKAKLDKDVANTPKPVQQKLLDLLHNGKTIGEAREICKLDLMVACEIISRNIKNVAILKREVE